MPLLEREPNVIVEDLLRSEWSQYSMAPEHFESYWIHTGSYDEDSDHPEVSMGNVIEPTDPNSLDPSGIGLSSWVDGIIDCNVWVPNDSRRLDDMNAGLYRWQVTRQIHHIIEQNQEGTTYNGEPELVRLDTGELQRFAETDSEPTLLRMLIPIGFLYRTAPE